MKFLYRINGFDNAADPRRGPFPFYVGTPSPNRSAAVAKTAPRFSRRNAAVHPWDLARKSIAG